MKGSSGAALRKIVLASASLILFGTPVLAADPIAIADDIVAAIVDETRTATYATATADATGTIITITGFTVSDPPNGHDGAIAEIIVTNPVEVEAGGFTAEIMVLRNGSLSDSSNTLRFENVELTGVTVPPPRMAEAGADPVPAEAAAPAAAADPAAAAAVPEVDATVPIMGMIATGIVLEPPQANPIVLERIEMAVGDVAEGVPYEISAALIGLEVPLDLADDSELIAVIRSLGFETLFMDFNVAGAFDADNDTLHISSVGIAIREFGHIDFGATITGVALGQLAAPGGPEAILAAAMVNDVRVRFENGGAMEAFLREQAALTNLTPEDVAFGLAAAFQIFLRTLENPTLEQQVGQAVGAFLRDPRSITLVGTPPEPVPLMEIVGLLMSAPTVVPALLNIVVTAND